MTQAPAASLAEANEKVYTSLTYGIALEQNRGGGRKNRTVRFLDFDRTAVTFKETTCAGSARSAAPRAPATATTGWICRAAARRCAR